MMPVANEPAETQFDVEAGRHDLAYFAKYFFPRHCRLTFSRMHEYLFHRRQAKILTAPPSRRGELDVVIAPRGAAKSTLMSLIFPIHALLYELDPYIVLFSATQRQAGQRLANIRAMLLDNAELARAFPQLAEAKVSRASSHTLKVGESRMDAFSAGTEVRGINHGPWRPTWIILDDIERSDRIRSARHRDALADWFDEVIANLGNGYTNIDLIGTVLHRDALPLRLAERSDTHCEQFVSIESEARNEALWDEWRGVLYNLNDPERLDNARHFFEERREAMLEGASVLWPEKEDYYALCSLRERIGRIAFNKEKQNAPPESQATVFNVNKIRRFKIEGDRLVCEPIGNSLDGVRPEIAISDLRIGGYLDPSLGTANGDYAAIVTIGMDEPGYCYVLDVWLERASTERQRAVIFELYQKWDYEVFGLESVSFQMLMHSELECDRALHRERGEKWQLPLKEDNPHGKKESRITVIEPHISNGWMLFNETIGKLFLEQLDAFPCGRHDDGPDALASAFRVLRAHKMEAVKPKTVPRAKHVSATAF